MGSIIIFFIIWCIFAVPLGWFLAYLESRLLNQPIRLLRSILLTVFLGVLGILIIGIPMIMKWLGGINESQRVQAEAARLLINQNREKEE